MSNRYQTSPVCAVGAVGVVLGEAVLLLEVLKLGLNSWPGMAQFEIGVFPQAC